MAQWIARAERSIADELQTASTSDNRFGSPAALPADRDEAALRQVMDAMQSLGFGSVLVVVQDGVIVQIERQEKVRPGLRSKKDQSLKR